MTLDEAIKHAEDVADKKESEKQKWDKWLEHDNDHRAVAEMASCESCAEEHRQLAELLRELKKLREQTRWIPVSEGFPEPWASVLITFSGKYGNLTADHTVGIGSLDGINGWYFEEIEGYTDGLTVEAWMPLPEPYKAESNLDGDPVDIDKAVEHYEGTLETLKGIDLEVDG